jgi:hypothetical protein
LLQLLFDPEEGGKAFLENIRELLSDYTVLYTRRIGLLSYPIQLKAKNVKQFPKSSGF